jgi:hypothetical protein
MPVQYLDYPTAASFQILYKSSVTLGAGIATGCLLRCRGIYFWQGQDILLGFCVEILVLFKHRFYKTVQFWFGTLQLITT